MPPLETPHPVVRPRARLARVLVGLSIGAAAVWLLPVSLAALVPRTAQGAMTVLAVVAAALLWSRLVVPRLTGHRAARTGLAALPVVLLAAVVLVPALVDRDVDESLLAGLPADSTQVALPQPAIPPAEQQPAAEVSPSGPSAEPERLSGGALQGVGHEASGEAVVYRSGATTFVRLQDLEVQGAIDVVVWLVPAEGQTTPDGGIVLGQLKGTRGNANYLVPDGVDPGQYRTVLLWCRAFSTPIAVATAV